MSHGLAPPRDGAHIPVTDPIAAFYDQHPYPPPVAHLDGVGGAASDDAARRHAHHLVWPHRPYPAEASSTLVAGCGTSQGARYAMARPGATVVGIDVSATSIDHTRRLVDRHAITNLEVHRLPIERVAELDRRFDHVVCTGVLHHLADPAAGLSALRGVLAPGGAMTLMVYARYGRVGIDLLQDYCRRLGITATPRELDDLVATLRELPTGHPLGRLLRETRDFHDDGALADALLNPRDRAYAVPEVFELLDSAGLAFGRWQRQAPYLPDCGSISETPHRDRLLALPRPDQYAAVELFRGTIVRHTVIAFADGDGESAELDFDDPGVVDWTPLPAPTAVVVTERLPPGAAAVLLNRAHTATDLVVFVDRDERDLFERIDGRRTIGELGPGAGGFVRRLWRHDLVAMDTTTAWQRRTT